MLHKHLEQLVAIGSVSGNEQQISDFLAEACTGPYHTVHRLETDVAVHINGKDSRKALLLNGHTDTVPPGDLWTADPYTLRRDPQDPDERIGLGTSDMKSGLAVMLAVSEDARLQQPPCDIWLLFSSSEETDSSGSLNLASWFAAEQQTKYQIVGGIILEPTDADFVAVGHRGDTIWNVSADGPGGHASQNFENQPTALEKLSRFITDLTEIRQEWSREYTDPLLDRPTINPVTFQAGTAINVVPLQATAAFNLRATQQLAEALPGIMTELEKQYDVRIDQSWPPAPTNCDPQSHIYRTMRATLPDAAFQAFAGSTDQFAFHNQGIPMLIYGPGETTSMHQPDEWVRLSAIERCKVVIDRVIAAY